MKRDLSKRPIYEKTPIKQTCVFEKRPMCLKRDLCVWKDTYAFEKRPMHMEGDLLKRPVHFKRDQ